MKTLVTSPEGGGEGTGAVSSVNGQTGAVVITSPTGLLAYVDSINGDDSTGIIGRFDLPFASLDAAKAVATSGVTIVVRPGSYAPAGQCAWQGGAIYFMQGVTVTYTPNNATTALFDLTGTGISNFRVDGDADFIVAATGTFSQNGILWATTTNYSDEKNWSFRCRSVTDNTSASLNLNTFYAWANVSSGIAIVDIYGSFLGRIQFSAESYGLARFGWFGNKQLGDSAMNCQSEIGVLNMVDDSGGGTVWLSIAESLHVKFVLKGRLEGNHGGIYVNNPQANPCIVKCISGANLELEGHFISDVTGGAFKPAVEVAGGTNIRITGLLDTGVITTTWPLLVSVGSPQLYLTGCYLLQTDSETPLSIKCTNGATPAVLMCGSGGNQPFDSGAVVTIPAHP